MLTVRVIASDVFRDQPSLTGAVVTLEPLTENYLPEYLAMLGEPENLRLTGSHSIQMWDEEQRTERTRQWLSTRRAQHDRADWAILSNSDRAFLGEVVLNELDPDNSSVNFRIVLAGHTCTATDTAPKRPDW